LRYVTKWSPINPPAPVTRTLETDDIDTPP
jgi:hypothetical protein